MYKDTYDTFENTNIPYNYPFQFQGDGNKQDYMVGNIPTYEMDYGDTVEFPFCIDEKYKTFLIHMIIYNYRREEVYRDSLYPDDRGKVYLDISKETSAEILKRGVYYCQLQGEGLVNNLEMVCTLIPANDCIIYVR